MKLIVVNPPLFVRKLLLLLLSVGILTPLVVWKLSLPAYVYLISLLVLHVWIFGLYLYRVDWRQFSRMGLIMRIASVGFFAYLLRALDLSDTPTLFLNVALALTIHILILLVLMIRIQRSS